MRAHVDDRIVVAGGKVDRATRSGRIVEVQGAEGAPPYVVEWDDGRRALYFPGPDAHLEDPAPQTLPAARAGASAVPAHVRTWSVQLQVFEDPTGGTTAHALLSTGAPNSLRGRGEAHRRPGDQDVPEIGDEIAVARALRQLADALLSTAADDLSGVLGHEVRLPR